MASIFPGGDGGLEQGERFKEVVRTFVVSIRDSMDEAYQEYPNLFKGTKKEDILRLLDTVPELFFAKVVAEMLNVLSEGIMRLKTSVQENGNPAVFVAAVAFFRAAKEAEAREGGMDLLVSANNKAHDLILRLPKVEGKEVEK